MINAQKRKIIDTEFIFLIIYFLFAFLKVIFHTRFDTPWIDRVFFVICMALLAMFILDRRWHVKGWLWKMLVMVVFAISSYTTNRPFLMAYGMLIMCADVTSFRKIVCVSMAGTSIAVMVTVVACLSGFIENRETIIGGNTVGYAMGFNGRTGVPFHLFYVFLGYLYLKKNQLSWLELLFWAGVNYLMQQIFQVRLVYYLEYIVLALYILFVKMDFPILGKRLLCHVTTAAFPVSFSAWVLFNRVYDGHTSWMQKINLWLSGRLWLGNYALTRFELKFFGQYIKTGKVKMDIGEDYFYIDSGFLYSLMAYGLVFTIVVLLMYSVLSRYAFKMNQRVLLIWLVAIICFSLVNNTWVDVGFNPLLMAFSILLSRGTLEEHKDETLHE